MKDHIIDETVLQIIINGEKTFEMVFSMTWTAELAAGILFTQGIVRGPEEIMEIRVMEEKQQCCIILNRTAQKRLKDFKAARKVKGSSGGVLIVDRTPDGENSGPDDLPGDRKPEPALMAEQVTALIREHGSYSKLFKKTGAVHSAGLCSPDKILTYFEDIGRHNAVDKLAGSILLNHTKTSDKIVTLSCRMSLEIIGKIIRTGIPIVISNAAPTLGAVKLAEKAGLTIIGFARNSRFNIYTHAQRIT